MRPCEDSRERTRGGIKQLGCGKRGREMHGFPRGHISEWNQGVAGAGDAGVYGD